MSHPAPPARGPSRQSADVLARLHTLHPKSIDLSLGRIERLLHALGDPHLKLPPVIHVAGTNGKGSVIAFLRAVLEAAGMRVHAYTSPHLVRFHERIVLAGREISEGRLIEALEACERANAGDTITFFEITTAAAFHAFAETPADVVLLETGLGGRADATNVISDPALTVITPVGLDHQDFLGGRLELIAGEKAGVLKPGVPCVLGPQEDAARRVIEVRAEALGAPVIACSRDFSAHEEQGRLVYQDAGGLLDLPMPRLVGRHQIDNAGTAIACLRALNWPGTDEEAIAAGICAAHWPARLQRLRHGPLLRRLQAGAVSDDAVELWLDGAHNLPGARALAVAMADMEDRAPMPLFLILGMLNTKDPATFAEAFAGLARRVVGVTIPDQEAARPGREIAAAAEDAGIAAQSAAGLDEAIDLVLNAARGDGRVRVLIAGSLYLAGHVLAENG